MKLRMVQGEFRSPHGVALTVHEEAGAPHLAKYVWNGEEISIHFEGFGCVTVYATRKFEIFAFWSNGDGPHFVLHGLFPEEYIFWEIDHLEQYMRDAIHQPFTKHGIDPQSYSLDELRLFGMGLVRGWKLARGIDK